MVAREQYVRDRHPPELVRARVVRMVEDAILERFSLERLLFADDPRD
jgi:hypothetical protein